MYMYIYINCFLQFEGVEISMDDRMGIFITMNPGYAGRTELPESIKALFRPVVVIVPDLEQICEIMLFSEGFLMAKVHNNYYVIHTYIHVQHASKKVTVRYIVNNGRKITFEVLKVAHMKCIIMCGIVD